MGDGHELDVERADVDAAAERDDVDRDLGRARLGQAARLGEPGGEARHIDRRAEPRPQLGQRADVILVGMSDDNADQILLRFFDEGDVGHQQIDAGQVLAGEGETDVDHQPFAGARRAEAVERTIHADLAETAKRSENQFVGVAHDRGLSSPPGPGRSAVGAR